MANERVRAAIYEAGLSVDEVAEALGKDRKTVERWISGHLPYRRNQHALAKLLARRSRLPMGASLCRTVARSGDGRDARDLARPVPSTHLRVG